MAAYFLSVLYASVCIHLVYSYEFKDIIDKSVKETETILTPADFENVKDFKEDPGIKEVLKAADVDTETDPILSSGKFEGDIAGHQPNEIKEFIKNSNYMGRNAIKSKWQLWPSGEIPYVLSSRYGPYSKRVIAKAMDEYHRKTCVKFVPRDGERDYIYLFPDEGCYSLVGRVGGRQPVSLDAGCIQTGTIVHELMHAVGFFHEQSRADRDDWIEIQWTNVIPEAKDQFEKYSLRTIQHLDAQYDYSSIMHYGPYAFSARPYSSGKTIKALKSGGSRMGQRDGFSKIDLEKINKLYQCRDTDIEEPNAGGIDSSGGDGDEGEGSDSGACEDYKWDCFLRKALGYCSHHRSTRENCRRTCNLCDQGGSESSSGSGSGSSTGGTSGSEVSGSGGGGGACEDRKSKCSSWKSSGYCQKYTKYMQRNCKEACGFCGENDASSSSAGGASSGEDSHVDTKTKVVPKEDSEESGSCQDKNRSHCRKWSGKGFCDKYPSYMTKKCQKSCNVC